jgi:hypothetical protein
MVGLFSKINKYFGKFTDALKDDVLPVIGKIGDAVNSDIFQGLASYAIPALNPVAPSLGSGLGMAMPYVSKAGKYLSNLSKQYSDQIITQLLKEFICQNVLKIFIH